MAKKLHVFESRGASSQAPDMRIGARVVGVDVTDVAAVVSALVGVVLAYVAQGPWRQDKYTPRLQPSALGPVPQRMNAH